LHRPLFVDTPDEPDTGYWSMKPQPRAWLLGLIARHAVRLVASGHLHRAHDFRHDATRYVWSPASSFLVGPAIRSPSAGEQQLGAVLYEIDGDALSVAICNVPGLARHWLDDVIDEVYPRPAKK